MIELVQGTITAKASRIILGAGMTLSQDADGVTTLDASGGGGSAPARADVAVTTASLANNAVETGTIAVGKSSIAVALTASAACRVRFYSTAAGRTADAARLIGTDPLGEHRLMLEVVIPASNLTWDLSPLAAITNDDSPPTSTIYYAIQNLSGAPAAITVTLSRIVIEV